MVKHKYILNLISKFRTTITSERRQEDIIMRKSTGNLKSLRKKTYTDKAQLC